MEGRESRWVSRHRSRGQYPSSYECESNGNLSVDTTTLSFAFEFIVAHPNEPIDEILVQDLPLLEYGILYRIGVASGILRCEFSEQAVDPWLLSTNNTSSANQSLVVALASNPSTLSDSQQCQFLDTEESELCIPMIGTLNTSYVGSNEEEIADYLVYHLTTEMNSQRVVFGNIKEVFFVGPTNDATASVGEPGSSRGSLETSNGSLVPVIVAVPIILVAALGLFAYLSQNGSRRNRTSEDDETDPNSKSRPHIIRELEEDTSADRLAVNGDVERGARDDLSTPSDILVVTEPREICIESSEDVEDRPENMTASHGAVITKNPSNDSIDSLELEKRQATKSLPPLPPGTSTNKSKATNVPQRRRRKRKKKKKAVLTRVNSRDNVKEMETIQEGEESSDDESYEYASGSECSWSTDEPDSHSNSRDPSPNRQTSTSSPIRHAEQGQLTLNKLVTHERRPSVGDSQVPLASPSTVLRDQEHTE